MKALIFQAGNDWTGMVIRLTLGIVLFPHGAQKTLGWFGGPGFTGEMKYFTGTVHLSWITSLLIILIESLGALCLLAGFAGRIWGVTLIILFLGMIIRVHHANGFFMNWSGTQAGEGFEIPPAGDRAFSCPAAEWQRQVLSRPPHPSLKTGKPSSCWRTAFHHYPLPLIFRA
ncbi:MAG TPA: DoxX family protein [Puia sp.]|nr:DoxX family protein [Puia sp.]